MGKAHPYFMKLSCILSYNNNEQTLKNNYYMENLIEIISIIASLSKIYDTIKTLIKDIKSISQPNKSTVENSDDKKSFFNS